MAFYLRCGLVCLLAFVGGLLSVDGCHTGTDHTSLFVAESIRRTYDSSLANFDAGIQRHYAVRLYRMSGDEVYMGPIRTDVLNTITELQTDIEHATSEQYIAGRCMELTGELNPKTRKGRMRLAMFKQHGIVNFYLKVLYNTNQLSEYCLDRSEKYGDVYKQSVELLSDIDFREFLLDTAVIRVFSPQAVNYVYYLYYLEIVDLRKEYETAFRTVFADRYDQDLSRNQYMDKIYGMTHFITAASRYYQEPVDSSQFSWIINYFTSNLRRILDKTKADIVAEVGICYLLTGQSKDPAVAKCRRFIVDRFDNSHNLIPSPTGRTDPTKGEHRNVLAYMLLSWPPRLTPGPCLQ